MRTRKRSLRFAEAACGRTSIRPDFPEFAEAAARTTPPAVKAGKNRLTIKLSGRENYLAKAPATVYNGRDPKFCEQKQ